MLSRARRVTMLSDKGGDADKASVGVVIEQIVEELVNLTKTNLAAVQKETTKAS